MSMLNLNAVAAARHVANASLNLDAVQRVSPLFSAEKMRLLHEVQMSAMKRLEIELVAAMQITGYDNFIDLVGDALARRRDELLISAARHHRALRAKQV